MFMKHGVLLCLAFGLIQLPNHGADPGGGYHLPDLSKDMSSLARITEAINLGEYLTDENADLELIAGELLNLGPNVTMSKLESAGVVGLDTDLESICSAVQTECGGSKCGDDKIISQGIGVFDGINVTTFDEAEKALKDEKFGQIGKLNEHFDNVNSGKQDLVRLTSLLGALQNYTDSTFIRYQALWTDKIDEVLKSAEGVNQIVKSIETNDLPKLVDSISAILVLENATSSFPSQQSTLNFSKTEFQSISSKSRTLSAFLTAQSMGKFVKKANILSGLASRDGRSFDKLLTQGFPNGLVDVDLLSDDVSSSFVKNVVGAGQSMDELKSALSPVTNLRTKLKDVQKSWDAMKFPNDTGRSIANVQNLLDDAFTEFTEGMQKSVSHFDTFFKCVEKVNLEATFQFAPFAAALPHVNNLEKNMNDFVAAFKARLPNSLKENLLKVKALLAGEDASDVLTKLRSSTELKAADGMMTDFGQLIGDVDGSELKRTVNNLLILNLNTLGKWMADLGVKEALDCIAQKGGLPEPLKLKQSALLKLKTSDSDISTLRTIAKSVQGPIDEWKKTMTATKTKREAPEKPKNLKNIRKIAKSLADGAEKIRVLSEAYSIRSDIQQFMTSSEAIDRDIQGITDKKKQADALSVWTEKLKTWLTGLPASLETLDASLPKTRQKITDFGKVWNATDKFELLEVDAEKLRNVFKSINNPPGSAPVLQFVGYRGSLRSSIPYPLQELELLFSFYFNTETATGLAVIVTTLAVETGLSLLVQIIIIVGSFVGCGLITFCLICVYKYCKKKKNGKKAKTNKKKKSGSSSKSGDTGQSKDSVSLDLKTNPGEKKPEDLLKSMKGEMVRITLNNGKQIVGILQPSANNVPTSGSGSNNEGSSKKLSRKERKKQKKLSKTAERNKKRKEEKKKKALGLPSSNDSNLGVDGVFAGVKPEDVKKVERLDPNKANDKAVAKLMERKEKMDEKNMHDRGKVVDAQDCDHADPDQIMRLRRSGTKNFERNVARTLSYVGVLHEIRSYLVDRSAWMKTATMHFVAFGPCSTEVKDDTLVTVSERDPSAKISTARDETQEEKEPELTQVSSRASAAGDDWKTRMYRGGMSDEEWERARQEEDRVDAEYERSPVSRWEKMSFFFRKHWEKIWKKNPRTDDPEIGNIEHEEKNQSMKRDERGSRNEWSLPIILISENETDNLHKSRAQASGENEVAASPSNVMLRKKNFKPLSKSATDEEAFKYCQKWFADCLDKKGNLNICLFLAVMCNHWFRSKVSFRNEKTGHPCPEKVIIRLLDLAIAELKKQPAYIEVGDDCTVAADLHGVYKDMQRILFGRGHIYSEPKGFVFTGDYVDRGERSLCCALMMAALIVHSPNNYHFLRGNHEVEHIHKRYGFRKELEDIFGAEKGEQIRRKIQEMFNYLPMAANIKGKGFACHGMPPMELCTHERGMELIKKFPMTELELNVHRSLLWSDPIHQYNPDDYKKPFFKPTGRGTPGVMDVGPVVVHEFLKKFSFQFVVRGHQMNGSGFKDEFGDGTCYTLYSATNQRDIRDPNYRNNNYAATMEIRDDKYWFDRYMDYGTFDKEGDNLDEVTIDEPEEDVDAEKGIVTPGDNPPKGPNTANADQAVPKGGTLDTGTANTEKKKAVVKDAKPVDAPIFQKKAPDVKQKLPIPKPSSAPPKK